MPCLCGWPSAGPPRGQNPSRREPAAAAKAAANANAAAAKSVTMASISGDVTGGRNRPGRRPAQHPWLASRDPGAGAKAANASRKSRENRPSKKTSKEKAANASRKSACGLSVKETRRWERSGPGPAPPLQADRSRWQLGGPASASAGGPGRLAREPGRDARVSERFSAPV